jgi:hypothetical protein
MLYWIILKWVLRKIVKITCSSKCAMKYIGVRRVELTQGLKCFAYLMAATNLAAGKVEVPRGNFITSH